jgi:hypothetical protein
MGPLPRVYTMLNKHINFTNGKARKIFDILIQEIAKKVTHMDHVLLLEL